MSDFLNCTLIQTELIWEDIQGNLELLTLKINDINEATDLIILPEMFTTGFSMTPQSLAENMSGSTVTWMKEMAQKTNACIMGSCIIQEEGHYFNRLIVAKPNGDLHTYDKRHLFTLAGEDKDYSNGSERLIIEIKGWKVFPLICYDLRFPVWSRQNVENSTYEYDLIIYMANWPAPRINAWDTLLKARAIENQSYSIGVNRLGVDGNNLEYPGHSSVNDYMGNSVVDLRSEDSIISASLDKSRMEDFRTKYPFLKDGDRFDIK